LANWILGVPNDLFCLSVGSKVIAGSAIVEFVRRFGWHLDMDELDLRMVTALDLLGFIIDTGDLAVGVPVKRRAKLFRTVRAVLAAPHAAVVRDVCRVIGQI